VVFQVCVVDVFVVVVIESEPCTRNSLDTGCDEDSTTESDSWSEALSPLRALLSTRDVRAALVRP